MGFSSSSMSYSGSSVAGTASCIWTPAQPQLTEVIRDCTAARPACNRIAAPQRTLTWVLLEVTRTSRLLTSMKQKHQLAAAWAASPAHTSGSMLRLEDKARLLCARMVVASGRGLLGV